MTDPDYFASSRFASLNNPMSESWVIRVYFGMPAACPFWQGLSRNCGLSGLAGSSTLLVRPDANYPREALRRRLPTITAQRQVRRPAEMKARRESARPGTVPIRREFVAQYWPPVPPRGHCECRMEVFVSLRGFSTAQ